MTAPETAQNRSPSVPSAVTSEVQGTLMISTWSPTSSRVAG